MDADDRAQLLDLLSAYSYGYDARQWDLYRSIWADDAALETTRGTYRTPAGIEAHAREWRETLAGRGIQTRHYQTNSRFEPVGADRVNGRTMLLVLWQHDGQPAPVPMHTGEYLDEFVRTPSGWRLARRQVIIDHD